ncbi:MAG: hypothetical protein DIU68_013840 [Chloroflexota bacterium]|nr:MAG: hypothetical protein DIU68_17060 [Chloroflexota bacterium]
MIYRYSPRFFSQLRRAMTAASRGPYPRLSAWARQTRDLVRDVIVAANAVGIDEARRRALLLHIDHRDISMETILATIRYHAAEEYPYLLRHESSQNLLALHATNLNDRYFVLQLTRTEALQVEPLISRLEALRSHLDNVPDE